MSSCSSRSVPAALRATGETRYPLFVLIVSGVINLKSEYLEYNLALAISMARMHYARVREKIPSDLTGWAGYWKRFYNTPQGKGTEEEFVYNYKQYVL